MWIIILIIFTIFIVLIVLGNNLATKNDNILVVDETLAALNILQDFSQHPYFSNECGLVTIIPINKSGEMYAPNSDRLEISILLYGDNINMINHFAKQTNIENLFRLEQRNNNICYVTTTLEFCGSYKKLMKQLNSEVQKEYINTEFDGSRIMIKSLKQ